MLFSFFSILSQLGDPIILVRSDLPIISNNSTNPSYSGGCALNAQNEDSWDGSIRYNLQVTITVRGAPVSEVMN